MDNKTWISRMQEGAEALQVTLPEGAMERLTWFADELLRWNEKVNLTAITAREEVLEKHLLDSLALQSEVRGARSVLDLGAGAGFPGLPLALVLPETQVTLVDSVAKKVGFMKHAIAGLVLAPRVRAVQVTARGRPLEEKLPLAEVVVCRALMDVPAWLDLARTYLAPGGRALALVASTENRGFELLAATKGYERVSERSFVLPFSGAPRAVVAFRPV